MNTYVSVLSLPQIDHDSDSLLGRRHCWRDEITSRLPLRLPLRLSLRLPLYPIYELSHSLAVSPSPFPDLSVSPCLSLFLLLAKPEYAY